jgi:hypothetical protein
MAFNWDLRVPYLYSNRYITLRDLHAIMLPDYHPEYVRRFIGWLHYKNGNVGAGGLSRTEQPNLPGFAPSLLTTFHWAGQTYNDGRSGACAVDTVHRDGPDLGDAHDGIAWTEVPIQGTAEAVRWGLHANVGVPGDGESWHIQPIEIDGHASWVAAGRPAPRQGYPIPLEHDPDAQTTPPPTTDEDDAMFRIRYTDSSYKPGAYTGLICNGTQLGWIGDGHADIALGKGGARVVDDLTTAELDGLIKTLQTTSKCPPEWVNTPRGAVWTANRG